MATNAEYTDSCRCSSGFEIPAGMSLAEIERRAVQMALDQHHGNRTRAAASLGISVRTLQRKLKAWGQSKANEPEPSTPG
jgi:DNA-binding NtrC family response regulator